MLETRLGERIHPLSSVQDPSSALLHDLDPNRPRGDRATGCDSRRAISGGGKQNGEEDESIHLQ